jgi:hypothetical protein
MTFPCLLFVPQTFCFCLVLIYCQFGGQGRRCNWNQSSLSEWCFIMYLYILNMSLYSLSQDSILILCMYIYIYICVCARARVCICYTELTCKTKEKFNWIAIVINHFYRFSELAFCMLALFFVFVFSILRFSLLCKSFFRFAVS